MKAFITKTSDDWYDYTNIREFRTFEELFQFMRENGGDIVMYEPGWFIEEHLAEPVDVVVEIYDCYRE